jgi:hypothetical protein
MSSYCKLKGNILGGRESGIIPSEPRVSDSTARIISPSITAHTRITMPNSLGMKQHTLSLGALSTALSKLGFLGTNLRS